jgi:hypothetical protein
LQKDCWIYKPSALAAAAAAAAPAIGDTHRSGMSPRFANTLETDHQDNNHLGRFRHIPHGTQSSGQNKGD